MSLLNDVSIVVTPNGYKAEKLHAVVPISGAADMVVTRATNATRVNEDGLIESVFSNVPRIDYTGGGCPHILAEPQRTNNITNSETFGSTGWSQVLTGTAIAPIVTDNYAISPDGTQNAQRIQYNSGEGTSSGDRTIIRQNIGTQTNWFLSVFLKSATGADQKILWHTNADGTETTITNEWKRYELNRNGVTNSWFGLGLRGSVSTVNTADILVYGLQAEQGSYATSYIPTSGSTVTRNKDEFTKNNLSSLINDAEGVLFAEIAAFDNDVSYRYMGLTDGTAHNRVVILYYSNTNTIRAMLSSGNTKYFDDNYTVTDITDFHKIAIKWKVNDFALWIDGVERATDSAGPAPIGLNTLALDQAGANNWFGKVKQLQVYKTALTDNQLIRLTSESYESYSAMAAALTYTIQ